MMNQRRIPVTRAPTTPPRLSKLPGSRTALHDPRWPALSAALSDLHEQGRCAVCIVDADCGAGSLLILAVHYARKLGFTSIEGRGIDGSPALIGRARIAAARAADPAIGLEFGSGDVIASLRDEADLPADIILWSGPRRREVDVALSQAAVLVIAEAVASTDGCDA